jgi:signal transduction histidine kinase
MNWLLLSIWLLLPLAGFSQQSQVLRIDQLPTDGVLLNQGWTFHPGDDPHWAAPAFDDRHWQDVDPAQDIMQLHELRRAGIGWFRLRLQLDTSLRQQALALLLTQTVASEIYLDGRPLRRLGKVSGDPNAVKAAFASLEQVGLPMMEGLEHVLAVRVAFQPGIPYFRFGGVWNGNHCLRMHLIRENDVNRFPFGRQLQGASLLDAFRAGLFFLLAFLHLAFFLSYRQHKANLYFAATALLFALDALTSALINAQFVREAAAVGWLMLLASPCYPLGYFFLLLALYAVFGQQIRFFRRLLTGWLVFTMVLFYSSYEMGNDLMFLSTLLLSLGAIAMTVAAVIRRQEGARIILAGMAYSFVAFLGVLLHPYVLGGIEPFTGLLVFNSAAVSIPLAISLYLAVEFATTGKQLARRLREVTHLSELTLAQEREKTHLQEVDTLKSRFFANLSHEFRTPLSLIQGTVEKLQGQGPIPGEKQADYELIDSSAEKLLRMINQLLDLSRLEAGKLELHPSPLELSGFLERLAGSFVSSFERKGIAFRFTTPLQPVWVAADANKLEQILSNLLVNAGKFTPAGGQVRLSVVVQATEAGNCALQCAVQDTGIGIAPAQLPRIFDRFYQVDSSPTRHHEGTGIGLSLVKELVELHGGSITVESTEGAGTLFSLQLPLALVPAAANAPAVTGSQPTIPALSDTLPLPRKESPPPKGRPHILVIEDNQELRHFLQKSLLGTYAVTTAEEGLDGHRKALDLVPDLVLCDVMMPGLDG